MVGSHLAEFLLKETNWIIFGMVRWRSPLDNLDLLEKRINEKNRIFLKYGDLEDQKSIDRVISEVKPDFIFHLAAQSYPQTSFTSPSHTLNINILGTLRLLEAVNEYSPHSIIHICSSSEVFGRVSKEYVPIKENCSFHPASPYAISKIGTDLIASYYAEAYNLNIQITRMFTHTGPRRGDVFAESSFAKQIALIEAKKITPIVKCGNLNSLRTIADVRDAVRAYYMAVSINPIPGAIYNIGGNYSVTVDRLLKDLINLSPLKNKISIEVEKSRLRPIDADLQIPDCSKFMNHTGWKPLIPYEQTLNDLLNYWRNKVNSGFTVLVR